jgi:SHS2 domain-containing protein
VSRTSAVASRLDELIVGENDTTKADDSPWFHEFEHTGDLGIEVTASTRAELFHHAALALATLMVDTSNVRQTEEREVSIEATNDSDFMHNLLAELLCLFVADGFIWADAAVDEGDQTLRVVLRGERFDPGRHSFRGEIKAVTYHQLMVVGSPEEWRARIIFDT